VLREEDGPALTAKEVGERIGCTSEAARQRLHELQDYGDVESKQVGARAVVWWPKSNFSVITPVYAVSSYQRLVLQERPCQY
jgi:DNA-binding Lrp family transcriptional regulator